MDKFLQKFLIGSESTFLDNIDLLIMLKAMPTPITRFNKENCRLFNFNILQSAIIAYLNDDIVNAFDYFDLLNRDRVSGIRDLILYQKNNLNKVLEIMQDVKRNVQDNEEVYKEYQENSAMNREEALKAAEESKHLQNPKGLGELISKHGSQRKNSTKKKSKPQQ